MKKNLVTQLSFIVAGISFLLAFILFFKNTNEFWGSLGAAILTSALVWIAFVFTRLIILAIKK